MKKLKILAIIGSLIWVGATLLRSTSVMDNTIMQRILWVAPNFGATWTVIGLVAICYPNVTKKDFKPKYVYYITGIVFLLAITSEIIHDLFFNASFDIWDIAASITASIIFCIIHCLSPSK